MNLFIYLFMNFNDHNHDMYYNIYLTYCKQLFYLFLIF